MPTTFADILKPLDPDSQQPLYQQLQRALREAIHNQVLGPDDALPAERQIATDLEISRITVRKAIDGLVEEGLLVRRQGSGNFVAGRIEKNFAKLTSFSEDMRARGRTPRSEWLKRAEGAVTPEEALALRLSPGAPVFRFHRLRLADEAPAAVARQLEETRGAVSSLGRELRAAPPRAIVTCARGSSDHAATFAKYLFETRLGVLTASAAPSVASVYGARQDLRDCLFVAISQSGRSPDLVAAARGAREAGARVVVLVNAADSPLAAEAHHTIALAAGEELSVAATKSFIASLAAIAPLTAAWAADGELEAALARAPADPERAWNPAWSAASH